MDDLSGEVKTAVSPAAPAAEDHALAALSPPVLIRQALTGGVAPLVVYQICHHTGLSDASSLAISAAPPALAIAGEWLERRRLNIIGAIVLTGIVIGLTTALLLNGGVLLLKMRESVVTGLFGVVCLTTLVLPVRPAMFYVGRALASGGDSERRTEFDLLWHEPRARRVFTLLTLGWGLGFLIEAGVRALLAVELSTARFLAITPVVGWVVIGSLFYWTITYTRASRRQAQAQAQAESEMSTEVALP